MTTTIRCKVTSQRTLSNGLRLMRKEYAGYKMADVVDRMITENKRLRRRNAYLERYINVGNVTPYIKAF